MRPSRLVVLCVLAVVPSLGACGEHEVPLPPPVTLERVGESADPAADEDSVYNWRAGILPATARPERTPTFTCCERNLRITKGVVDAGSSAPAGGVTELKFNLKLKVKLHCERQATEGEGSQPPALCLATFQRVTSTTKPSYTQNPGGAAIAPVAERIWWTAAHEQCDGKNKNVLLHVTYIARFGALGVPRINTGENQSQLVLRFEPKTGGGTSYELTIHLAQMNQNSPFTATLASQRAL